MLSAIPSESYCQIGATPACLYNKRNAKFSLGASVFVDANLPNLISRIDAARGVAVKELKLSYHKGYEYIW